MSKRPSDIQQASHKVAGLPPSTTCLLPGGRQLTIRRLSWLEFDQLWQGLCRLVAALLLAEEEVTEERLAAELAGAPELIAGLASAATKIDTEQLREWSFDDVLALAAAAARFNFLDSQGIRDFFFVAGRLAADRAAAPRTGP